jgi:gliding motility-associated-like protein
VTQIVTSDDGCSSDSNRVPLVIGSYPVVDFSVAIACTGRPLPLLNQTTDSVGPISSWNWALAGQTYSDSLPAITPQQPGQYDIRLSVVSAEGCAASATRTFTVNPTPQVTFPSDSACAGTPLTLTGILLAGSVRKWFWLLDNNSLDSSQRISPVFNQEGLHLIRLWALSPQGCPSDTISQVDSIQASHAYAGDDTVVAQGYPLQLNARGGVRYTWAPSEGLTDPDIADPVANITQDTRYTLTAYSPAGCTSTATILVRVFRGPAIYVPSAFTPNGDGVNDVLKITAPGIRTLIYFRIFDRWGKEIFHTSDINATWDGTTSGRPLPPGAYVWMIQAIDLTGETLSQRGTIMLMR